MTEISHISAPNNPVVSVSSTTTSLRRFQSLNFICATACSVVNGGSITFYVPPSFVSTELSQDRFCHFQVMLHLYHAALFLRISSFTFSVTISTSFSK